MAPNKPSEISLLSRVRGSYLGLAIGDALGASVEFMTPREIAVEYGVHKNILGGGWLKLSKGQVTDDTTMALALGSAIIEAGDIDAELIARAFDQWMRDKPVDIGNTVRAGILHFRRSGSCVSPANEHSAGNGACMRCLPIAIATLGQSEQQVREASRCQAHITHHNALSDAGTEVVVLMLQNLFLGRSLLRQLHGLVQPLAEQHREFAFRRRPCRNPSGFIGDTLRVVFEALFDTASFEDCLIETVNRGGDADTTGAIAGMLAGAHYGEQAIPARWTKALDRNIRLHCEQQCEQLLQIAQARTPL